MIGIVVKRFHKNMALIAAEWPLHLFLPGSRPDLLSFWADCAPFVLWKDRTALAEVCGHS